MSTDYSSPSSSKIPDRGFGLFAIGATASVVGMVPLAPATVPTAQSGTPPAIRAHGATPPAVNIGIPAETVMERMADLETRLQAGVFALERKFSGLTDRIDQLLQLNEETEESGATAPYGDDGVVDRLDRAANQGSVAPELGGLIEEAFSTGTSSARVTAARALAIADPSRAASILPRLIESEGNRRARGVLAELLEALTG